MKYDDASWHYGGDFPSDLPPEAGATHIGIFLAWCFLNDLTGELHIVESNESLSKLKERQITGRDFLIKECDEKFTDEDLNEEGNQFAQFYFSFEKGEYITNYEKILGENLPSLYHVEDTWENYDRMKTVIDKKYSKWKKSKNKPRWKFW